LNTASRLAVLSNDAERVSMLQELHIIGLTA